MRLRIFTFLVAFLAIAGNAVWGQESTTIDITGIAQGTDWTDTSTDENGYTLIRGENGDNNVLTITKGGNYIITDNGPQTEAEDKSNVQIKFSEGNKEVNITLNGVKINASLDNTLLASSNIVFPDHCAMEIPSGVTVTLDWIGDNKLWSGSNRAGINVKPGATLILNGPDDSGSLEAGSFNNTGGVNTYGAGIGGDYDTPSFGNIIINSGKINTYSQVQTGTSNSNAYGAGISGGYNNETTSTNGSILIKGGTITARCDNRTSGEEHGAGIGGGKGGTCDNIIILGGTVEAISDGANDIGVGQGYSSGDNPEIIIGEWNENTTTNVTAETRDKTNYLDATGSSYDQGNGGKVILPEGTQMCLIAGVADPTNLGAYKVAYQHPEAMEEVSSTLSIPMAYGPNTSYTIAETADNAITEVDGINYQIFPGLWLDASNQWVAENTQKQTNEKTVETISSIIYTDAWVLKSHTVSYQTTSGLNGSFAIYYPYIEDLFTITDEKDEMDYTTLKDAGLEIANGTVQNDADGDCLLIGRDTPYKLNLNFAVTSPSSIVVDGIVNIYITDKPIDIAGLNISAEGHVYDGTARMNISIEDGKYPLTPFNIVYSTNYTAENPDAAIWTAAKPIDAGTYYIKISVKKGFEQSYTGEKIISASIQPRPMTIIAELNRNSINEDEELTWSDINIDIEPMNSEQERGLVTGEDISVTGTVSMSYEYVNDQTQAVVKVNDIDIVPVNEKFKESNYDINYIIGTTTYVIGDEQGDGETTFPEDGAEIGTIPVISTPSTGGTTTKKYELNFCETDFFTNQDYYDAEKLKLYSRYNKKHTSAGGSFTIWYTHNDIKNDGGYRIFISRNGARGDYKEITLAVNDLYQIRDVYSDIFVKIYGPTGFPVANEEISATDARAYAQANKIVVITPEPTDVQIISMAGAVVATDQVTGQREFANLMEGIYIVRMGDTVVKLQVRN